MEMKILLRSHPRDSVSVPASRTSVSYDGATLMVDEQHLPRELLPLIPPRSAHFAPEEWRPFCVLARTMGVL
jgi:hypothetical protein